MPTHDFVDINDLPVNPKSILVYGSNTEARHGKGVAKIAREKWGATYGKNPTALVGQSYGIITKDLTKRIHPSIPASYIIEQIKILYNFANEHKDLNFYVPYSASAQNLNAYSAEEMAKMFKEAGSLPENVIFETSFFNLIKNI
jgi:S-adenosylmethionine synthetase